MIADNVGDNVGDCAGMAADLFETYVVTVVATMLLGAIFFTASVQATLMLFPLVVGGVLPARLGARHLPGQARAEPQHHGGAVQGVPGAAVVSAVVLLPITLLFLGATTMYQGGGASFTGWGVYGCTLVGLLVTGCLMWITDYYTGTNHRPVQKIAQASTTGHATNIIQGLAVSMEATALPVVVICAGILLAYLSAGLYGIGVAATNARADRPGGLARRLRPGHRQCRRHRRDGRPAGRGARHHRCAGCGRQHHQGGDQGLRDRPRGARGAGAVRRVHRGPALLLPELQVRFTLSDPFVLIGLFLGGLCPTCSLRSPCRRSAAGQRDRARGAPPVPRDPGDHGGTGKPEYSRAVDMLTKAAIKEMIVPSMLLVLAPIVVYAVINLIAARLRRSPHSARCCSAPS